MSSPTRPISAIRQMQSAQIPDLLNELVMFLVASKPADPLTSLIEFLEEREAKHVAPKAPPPAEQNTQNNVRDEDKAREENEENKSAEQVPAVDAKSASPIIVMPSLAAAGEEPQPEATEENASSATPRQTPTTGSSPVGGSPRGKLRLRINADKSLLSQTELLGKEARRLIAAIETESTKQMSILGINQKPQGGLASSMSSSQSPALDASTSTKKALGLGALAFGSSLTPSLLVAGNNHRAMLAALESLGRHNEEISAALRDIGEAATPEQVSPRKAGGQWNATAISTLNVLEEEEDALFELIANSGATPEELAAASEAHTKMQEAMARVRHYTAALCT